MTMMSAAMTVNLVASATARAINDVNTAERPITLLTAVKAAEFQCHDDLPKSYHLRDDERGSDCCVRAAERSENGVDAVIDTRGVHV